MRKLLFAMAALIVASGALALEVAGVKLDDKASVGGQELVLNGAGIRTKVFIKIYVGSLYVPAKAPDIAGVLAKGPRRLQLNLLRDLSADQLIDALVDGMKANSTPDELAAISSQTAEMVATMKSFKDVKEKDVVTLDFVDGATKIGLNGAAKASIAGEPFNRALTRIWIGEQPAQSDLKKAMLGG
ncbi:MAG: chalcone isomerase family protein [Betaproteobacteria bacterium]